MMCERNLAKVSHSRANASLNTYSYATTTPTFNIFQHQICDNAEKWIFMTRCNVWAYCAHGRQCKCWEDPVSPPPADWRDSWVIPALRGSAPSNSIWNNTILRSPKQQIWLRIALCGGWRRRMVLRNLRVACQKRRRRRRNEHIAKHDSLCPTWWCWRPWETNRWYAAMHRCSWSHRNGGTCWRLTTQSNTLLSLLAAYRLQRVN